MGPDRLQTSADRGLTPCELKVRLVDKTQFLIEISVNSEATLEEYAMKLGQRGAFEVQDGYVYYHPPHRIAMIEWEMLKERSSEQ